MEKVYCRQRWGKVEYRAGWAMHLNNVNDTSYVLLQAQEQYGGEVLLTSLSRSAERQELINCQDCDSPHFPEFELGEAWRH